MPKLILETEDGDEPEVHLSLIEPVCCPECKKPDGKIEQESYFCPHCHRKFDLSELAVPRDQACLLLESNQRQACQKALRILEAIPEKERDMEEKELIAYTCYKLAQKHPDQEYEQSRKEQLALYQKAMKALDQIRQDQTSPADLFLKAKCCWKIGKYYLRKDFEKALEYFNQAQGLIETIQNQPQCDQQMQKGLDYWLLFKWARLTDSLYFSNDWEREEPFCQKIYDKVMKLWKEKQQKVENLELIEPIMRLIEVEYKIGRLDQARKVAMDMFDYYFKDVDEVEDESELDFLIWQSDRITDSLQSFDPDLTLKILDKVQQLADGLETLETGLQRNEGFERQYYFNELRRAGILLDFKESEKAKELLETLARQIQKSERFEATYIQAYWIEINKKLSQALKDLKDFDKAQQAITQSLDGLDQLWDYNLEDTGLSLPEDTINALKISADLYELEKEPLKALAQIKRAAEILKDYNINPNYLEPTREEIYQTAARLSDQPGHRRKILEYLSDI